MPIPNQAEIETYSRNLRRQLARRLQLRPRPLPMLLPHIDHAEVRVGPHIVRRDRKNLPERFFRGGQIPLR